MIEDCEGFDWSIFGQDFEDEEPEKTEDEIKAEEELWDGESIDDEDPDVDFDDKKFRKRNR